MDRTQNMSYNKPCLALTSKCDVDLEGKGLGVLHDMSSNYCENLCQVISKSLEQ
jgi:hypothetical protein